MLLSGESSDDCARGGDTSSSRSLQPYDRKGKTKAVECEGREEAGSDTYYAPRGPKTQPPGTRLAPPYEEAGPLSLAATVGYMVAGAPLIAASSLRGDDGVDDTAVKFLLRAGLLKEEEEKERKAEEEKHERRMLALDHRAR